jgi:steroid 5-alpha reductase family enzyme
MSSTTLVFAFAYLVLGIAGFVLTGSTHKTALIPCIFGILFLVFGLLARKDNLRKHVMHAAVLIALLAFLGTARSLPHLPELFNGTAEKPASIITQSLNAGLSLLYIILAVRSFIQARRARSS